jgi:preprotein translocase subunit SecY
MCKHLIHPVGVLLAVIIGVIAYQQNVKYRIRVEEEKRTGQQIKGVCEERQRFLNFTNLFGK